MEVNDQDNELFEHYRYVVDKGQSPLRIDKYLVNKIEGTSRTRIQEAAEAGCIQANGKSVKSNYKVKPGEIITIVLEYPPRETEIIPQNIPLDIVYEDDDLIVINKKPGKVVHPSYGHYSDTLVNAIAYHLKDLPFFNQNDPRPGLVHRLDKNTSGIIVIAKNEISKNKLALQFFERSAKNGLQLLVRFKRYASILFHEHFIPVPLKVVRVRPKSFLIWFENQPIG